MYYYSNDLAAHTTDDAAALTAMDLFNGAQANA
jgi:hypothetical protein